MYDHSPLGLISCVRIVVDKDGIYDYQVLLFTKEKWCISNINKYLALCEQISARSGYKFCPGINHDMYKGTYHDIRYDPKSLRSTVHPVQRIGSNTCALWHKLAKNANIFEKDMAEVKQAPLI